MKTNILIIGGPTASGKSKLALDLAEKLNGVIINGDSMQIYKDLHLLTAKPSKQDLQKIEHRLYGVLDLDEPCSVAKWQKLALKEIDDISRQGKTPIIVGGTGLYLNALVEGLSSIPEVSPKIRTQARKDYDQMGSQKFHDRLKEHDPTMGEKLPPEDRQRCIRAWEVFQETGKSISEFQGAKNREPIKHLNPIQIMILPDRGALNQRSEDRFDQMMEGGALEEVKALLQNHPQPNHPLAKAVGVPELTSYLRGEVTLDEAIELAKISTRQYAKRQSTWFRNQVKEAYVVDEVYSGEVLEEVLRFVKSQL